MHRSKKGDVLLDHLISAREQEWRDRKPKRLRES